VTGPDSRETTLPTSVWAPLVALTALWNGAVLWGGRVWFFHDLRHHHYPWRAYVGAAIADGELPSWAPIGHGFPLIADGQSGGLYPPNWLLFGALPPWLAFGWSGVGHQLLAALGAAFLARTLGRSAGAAVVAGVAWAFGGFVVSHLVYFGMFCVLAWLPWMAAFAVRAPHRAGAAGLGLSVGMAWLAGHPQLAWLGTLLTVFLGIWTLNQADPATNRPWGRGAARLAAGWALAAAIAAPQLVASAQLTAFSARDGGLDAAPAALGSLPPEELPTGIFPSWLGVDRPADVQVTYDHRAGNYQGRGVSSWEDTWYLGVPVVLLALAARTRGARPWWVVFLVGVIAALGVYSPLYPLFRFTLGAAVFRFPVRALALSGLAAGQLAAIGVDRLRSWATQQPWRADRFGRAVTSATLAGLVGATLITAAIRPLEPSVITWLGHRLERSAERRIDGTLAEARDAAAANARASAIVRELYRDVAPWDPRVFVPAALAFGTATVVMATATRRQRATDAGFALAALLAADLGWFGYRYNPTTPVDDVLRAPSTITDVPPLDPGFRTAILGRRVPASLDTTVLSANLGLIWGIDDPEVPSPLRLRDVERWNTLDGLGIGASDPPIAMGSAGSTDPDPAGRGDPPTPLRRWREHRVLSRISGVRRIYSRTRIPELALVAERDVGPETAAQGNRTSVYTHEDPTALPRAYVVGCTVNGGADPLMTTANLVDPTSSAVASTTLGCDPTPAGTATVPIGRTSLNFEASLSRTALVVLTETRYPGQRWYVDGTPATSIPVNALFQGSVLRPGRHTIRVEMTPAWLWALAGVSSAVMLVCAGLCARTTWGHHTQARRAPSA
jgi:hypothetical protein